MNDITMEGEREKEKERGMEREGEREENVSIEMNRSARTISSHFDRFRERSRNV